MPTLYHDYSNWFTWFGFSILSLTPNLFFSFKNLHVLPFSFSFSRPLNFFRFRFSVIKFFSPVLVNHCVLSSFKDPFFLIKKELHLVMILIVVIHKHWFHLCRKQTMRRNMQEKLQFLKNYEGNFNLVGRIKNTPSFNNFWKTN